MKTIKHLYLIALAFFLFIACEKENNEEGIKPVLKDISEYVYASASVVSQNQYRCRPSESGIIQEVFIKKGDRVKKGQLLFKINPSARASHRLDDAVISLQEMEKHLYGNSNKLNNIEVRLQRLKEQNSIDSLNYQRKKRLFAQKIGSKVDLEQTLLVYQNSSNQIQATKLEYQQLKANLESSYKKAFNQVSAERGLLKDLEIRSKIDGEVFDIFREAGEFISPQEVFAEIGNIQNFIIEMNIDEVDIPKVEIGDTAIIALEAYPDEAYTATLNFISNTKDLSTQTFLVEGTFTRLPSKLFNGLAGEVNILVGKRKGAMVIPSEYLAKGSKVLTEAGEVSVKTGMKNLEYVEIVEGVDTSTVLLKPEIQ